MTKPSVSICIPVYNGERFLGKAIQSALDQTYPHVRVFLRDNASTDGTAQVATQYAQAYPERVHYVRSPVNEGMTANWNAVLRLASDDLVVLLSADDYLLPDMIESCLSSMREDHVAVTTNYFFLRGEVLSGPLLKLGQTSYRNFTRLVILRNPFSINFTLFRREFLSRLSENGEIFPVTLVTCDYDLWIRISLSGQTVRFLDKPLGVYRMHADNLSKQVRRMRRETTAVLIRHREQLARQCYFAYKFTLLRFLARICGDFLLGRGFDGRHAEQQLRLLAGGSIRPIP